jgi:hypothetical protein
MRGQWKKDKADRGIYLRGKKWYIRFADQNGKMQVEACGISKTAAMKVLGNRKSAVNERRYLPASSILWEELVDAVVADKRQDHALNKRPREFKSGNYGIVREWFIGRPASSITTEEIEQQLKSAQTKATFNRKFYAVHHVFREAIRRKKLSVNPAAGIRAKRETNQRVRWLNQHEPDEEQRLRAAIRELCPEREAEIDLACSPECAGRSSTPWSGRMSTWSATRSRCS